MNFPSQNNIILLRFIKDYENNSSHIYFSCLNLLAPEFYIISNKSSTWCNSFSVYYPDVCLQLNMFRAFFRPSSGAQWLQWQPLVLPSYCGESCCVCGRAGWPDHEHSTTNVRIINWKIVASGWWFIWIVRWCMDLKTLNFTFKF